MRKMIRTLRWFLAAALLIFATGCIKVRHLGDDVSKSFYKAFRNQRRRADPDTQNALQPMGAELAGAAADVLTGEKAKNAPRNTARTFQLPAAATNSSGDD